MATLDRGAIFRRDRVRRDQAMRLEKTSDMAPGPDRVPDLVVKEVATYRPEILYDVFKTCFKHGILPGA